MCKTGAGSNIECSEERQTFIMVPQGMSFQRSYFERIFGIIIIIIPAVVVVVAVVLLPLLLLPLTVVVA